MPRKSTSKVGVSSKISLRKEPILAGEKSPISVEKDKNNAFFGMKK